MNWAAPDAKAQLERIVRQMALDDVNAYRQGGNARLAVYRTPESDVRRQRVSRTGEGDTQLTQYLPDMRQYLLDYPKPVSRPTSLLIYWQEAEFGLKPTVRLNHVAIQDGEEATVVASKQLYSSHYFWTALELRVLILSRRVARDSGS